MAIGDYLGILGLAVSVLLSPLYGDRVQDAWAWFGSKIKRRGRIRLAGDWKQAWLVESNNFESENATKVTISQIGSRIEGSFVGSDKQEYTFVGRIEGNYVTGTWTDRQQGNVYWGGLSTLYPSGRTEDEWKVGRL